MFEDYFDSALEGRKVNRGPKKKVSFMELEEPTIKGIMKKNQISPKKTMGERELMGEKGNVGHSSRNVDFCESSLHKPNTDKNNDKTSIKLTKRSLFDTEIGNIFNNLDLSIQEETVRNFDSNNKPSYYQFLLVTIFPCCVSRKINDLYRTEMKRIKKIVDIRIFYSFLIDSYATRYLQYDI
eukprot:CAMPEP_0170527420 /NCGR_PEP_ID=MMETSP0209-20121228/12888_1 /TAXON_ID=665100 ORGANISM="Litonotus pictus, Strain P1" /NCGR_SAMPLE_ID=MMETSP0209 /ASSEMBLY_ACC=CAM_ASM_000301 /LENGTH=181 /DNA_ID=CAMNT_0010817925 /DNA_START=2557 /DNA_END=3102 /DNA_ORIENTATION=-